MGPLSEESGDPMEEAEVWQVFLLQWGRSPKRAETCTSIGWPMSIDSLQWGRSPKRAETPAGLKSEKIPKSFNGAALRRERRHGWKSVSLYALA